METEKHILSRIASGDHSAYEYLYKTYYSQLVGFANSFFHEEGHEVVQDALLKIWENRETITEVKNLKAYLFQSVRNACLNHIKRKEVIQRYETEAAIELKQLELEAMIPDIDNAQHEAIRRVLSEMPEQRRKIFLLSFVEGYKAQEIGEQFGISERTVHTHVYNAMKFLKEKIGTILPVFVLSLFFIHNY